MNRLKQEGERAGGLAARPVANEEGLVSKVGIVVKDFPSRCRFLRMRSERLIRSCGPSGGISRAIDREPQAREPIDGIGVSRPRGPVADEQRGVTAPRRSAPELAEQAAQASRSACSCPGAFMTDE